jgi:TM2 domain-containing membrane protein YozV
MSFGPQPPEPQPWPGHEQPGASPQWLGPNQQWPNAGQQWPGADQQWPGANPRQRPSAGPRSQAQEQYLVQPVPDRWEPLPQPGMVMQPTVAPKNPATSVLLSVFIPGLGSMVNGNVGTGVTILLLNIVGLVLSIVLIGIPLLIGTWIWGLVDAYRSAQQWNAEHGIIS